VTGKNRIMIYGPKDDGTYVVEFMTADGDVLSRSRGTRRRPPDAPNNAPRPASASRGMDSIPVPVCPIPLAAMLQRSSPLGFIEPCLPSPADQPPTGNGWIHEIKHDGFRLMARRDPIGIRLLTRNGYDWSPHYPAIVEAVDRLKVRSCLIDGEAVACNDQGLAVFDRLRYRRADASVFLYAFDLLELDGQDLRREPLETRKATLSELATRRPSWRSPERSSRTPGWRGRLPPCLRARLRGYSQQAARLAVSQRPLQGLAEVQESNGAGREAGGGRGVARLSASRLAGAGRSGYNQSVIHARSA
jgi:hypothetical protein